MYTNYFLENIVPAYEKAHPNDTYVWSKLCWNKNLTRGYIYKHPTKNYDWKALTENEDIVTQDFVEHHIGKPWNFRSLSKNPAITLEFMYKYKHKNWDFKVAYETKKMSNRDIASYFYKPCHWFWFSKNKYITGIIIASNINKQWNWKELSKIAPLDIIKYNQDCPWDWDNVCKNPNLTPEFFDEFSHKLTDKHFLYNNQSISLYALEKREITKNKNEIDWVYVSRIPFLTPDFLRKHEGNWNIFSLSSNPNITLDYIEEMIDPLVMWYEIDKKRWDWFSLGYNPHLTQKFITKYASERWDWRALSMHKCVTPEFIENNPLYKWEWKYVSMNPNITEEFVENNINKEWNWNYLSEVLSPEFVEKYSNIEPFILSCSKKLSPEYVMNNIEKDWEIDLLLCNESVEFKNEKWCDYPMCLIKTENTYCKSHE